MQLNSWLMGCWRKIYQSNNAFPSLLKWNMLLNLWLLHWGNYISNSFHISWDMTVVTVFLSILNQMDFHLVQNWKENCHHGHIPFNVKGIGNIVFSVHERWWNCPLFDQTSQSLRSADWLKVTIYISGHLLLFFFFLTFYHV